jgi:hypothetical protein
MKSIDCLFGVEGYGTTLRAERKFTFSRLQAGSADFGQKSAYGNIP